MSAQTDRAHCHVTDKELRPCHDLDDALEDGTPKRGLVGVQAFISRRPRATLSHVVALSGMHVPCGLLIRHCPFCGADIGGHVHDA